MNIYQHKFLYVFSPCTIPCYKIVEENENAIVLAMDDLKHFSAALNQLLELWKSLFEENSENSYIFSILRD